jgi:TolB-like protein
MMTQPELMRGLFYGFFLTFAVFAMQKTFKYRLIRKFIHKRGEIMKKAGMVLLFAVLLVPVLSFGKARDEDTFKFYDDVQYNSVKITSVALLPFKNNVGKQTSEEVSDLFESVKEVLESKGIKVVDATPELDKQKVDVAFDDIVADKLTAIGKALGTDAVLSGSIYKFQTSKKGIATVGISGDMVLTSSGSYIYRAKLAREKKINATKKWITGVFRGESKGNRMKALNDCVTDLLNPLYEKLGSGTADKPASEINKKSDDNTICLEFCQSKEGESFKKCMDSCDSCRTTCKGLEDENLTKCLTKCM